MKKLLISAFLFALPLSAIAGECGINKIVLSGWNQFPADNEFLYSNINAWNSVKNETKNGTYTVSGGLAYECDNEYCPHNTPITLPAGHYFEGKPVSHQQTYYCHTNGLRESRWWPSEEHFEKKKEKVCGESSVSFDGQSADDDEFLYSSMTAYNSVKNRADGGTVNGLVYECDNDHCKNNKQQQMPANHVFQGIEVPYATTYICRGPGIGQQDRWVEVFTGCEYLGVKVPLNNWYVDSKGTKIPLNYGQCIQFSGGKPSDTNATFFAKCEKTSNGVAMVCYQNGKTGQATQPDKDPQKTGNDATRCANSGGTWSANKVCVCDANKNLVTSGGVCVCKSGTNWINSKNKKLGCKPVTKDETDANKKACETEKAKISGATWDPEAKECKCVNHKDGYKQTFDEKEGICKLDDKVAICLGIEGATWSVLQDECVCKDETLKPNEVTKKCEKTQAAIAAEEEEAALIQKIRSAYTKLQGLESGLGKVTVWKTADGKFNTSRLVSDSVAGVVLGTTGALVTSHLVKKKQVEDGFEDIQCVVGGQVVADWGDSFNVGIKN